MNTYKKYCPNVFVAVCDKEYDKGDVITVTTRRGKENEHIVHNLVGVIDSEEGRKYCYSITRLDGFDSKARAAKKAERLRAWGDSAEKRSDDWWEKSKEGKDFLALGEPIKVGHHSESRHRGLIDRNHRRMRNAMTELDKAEAHRRKAEYWERMSSKVDLSMPESLEFFAIQLEEAKEYHAFLLANPDKRPHHLALGYAKKKVNELAKKLETAKTLWA